MGEVTGISWTHHTHNAWEGCAKVSAGCKNCYAETRNVRFHEGANWGPDAPRRLTSLSNRNLPHRWNRIAGEAGRRERVFCSSLSDVLEDRRDLDPWREDLWKVIEATPNLDWQILTKRPENAYRLFPRRWWDTGFPRNVWFGATAEDQENFDARIAHVLAVPAVVRFLSVEPMLGEIDMSPWSALRACRKGHVTPEDDVPECPTCGEPTSEPGISWVICGGESGAKARVFDLAWARTLRRECAGRGIPFFFKQYGDRAVDRDALRFVHDPPVRTVDGQIDVYGPGGVIAANIWPHADGTATWHTWDLNGVGGENGTDKSVATARAEAVDAILSAGHHTIPTKARKGEDPAEWPEDLRVREFPRGGLDV